MPKKKIYLSDLIQENTSRSYEDLYQEIVKKIEEGIYSPIKNSGLNGKKPALYQAYWHNIPERDYSEILEQLQYRINPTIDISHYLKHPDRYEKDRDFVEALSVYLDKKKENLKTEVTINERSFEIFQNEKYLDRNGGRELLAQLGLSKNRLNFYETSEPMSYYSHSKSSPQNFLIIENKDTFYSMRKHLIECGERENTILGLKTGTLIYGSGKGIYKTFEDYIMGVEPYFKQQQNQVWYFGDLDYEGILIYETLCQRYHAEIKLFTAAYLRMLKKAEEMGLEHMPCMKEGQNKNIGQGFLNQFDKKNREIILDILESGHYIPQEILNEMDYGMEQKRNI